MINLIKIVFFDVFSLFKSFFHWNISKMIISFFRFLLGGLFALPFFILLIIIVFTLLDWSVLINTIFSGNIGANFWSYVFQNIYSIILAIIVTIFVITGFLVGYFYGGILLFNYNLHYLKGERLAFWNKSYLNFREIFKYTKILGWIFLYLLMPLVIFIVLTLILGLLLGGVEGVSIAVQLGEKNIFSIVSFILLVITYISVFYLLYRLSFSYLILLDKENYPEEKNAKFYVKESMRITSSPYKVFKILVIVILFTLIMLPFLIIGRTIDDKYNNMRSYVAYELYLSEAREFTERETYAYSLLKLEYDNIDKGELRVLINNYSFYQTLFYIFNYLFIFGVFEMVFTSFYVNELRDKKVRKSESLLKKIFTKNKEIDKTGKY